MKDGLAELHPSRNVARRMHELETELQRARMHLRRHSKSVDTVGRWGLEQPVEPQQEEGWFVTYLDMMTLLLVVMIVMLAFSGSLNDLPGQSPQTAEPPVSAPATSEPQVAGTTADTKASTRAGVTAETDDANVAASAQPGPESDSAGLLPGGGGLLHGGHAAPTLPATPPATPAATKEAVPGGMATALSALPPDATLPLRSVVPPSPGIDALYPGWSPADLAASFIGPPRPSAMSADDGSGTSTPATEADTPATEAITPAQPAVADAPSEGESLAAGLSLGDLGGDVEVVVNASSVSFRVNSEILFDSSQPDLSRSGLSVLRRIVSVLARTEHEITVEGHTDAVAVRRNVRFPSNWELSSARAGSVVRYLQANGIDGGRLKAIGYADTRPIGDNHTPDGRARNRRVELVIEKRD